MSRESLWESLAEQSAEMRAAGTYKSERLLEGPQRAWIEVGGRTVLNMCANNYLGLADHPDVVAAARESLDQWGYGLASVRFICGTQRLHKDLEATLSAFLGLEDTILYNSCWDANGGLFETILGPEDAIISDELNHASIIDGIRLCKAKRLRYKNNDMADLRARLAETKDARYRLVATDGVFSMDGYLADLPAICELADEFDALVMVDDSHAVGFVGPRGRGTPEHFGVTARRLAGPAAATPPAAGSSSTGSGSGRARISFPTRSPRRWRQGRSRRSRCSRARRPCGTRSRPTPVFSARR